MKYLPPFEVIKNMMTLTTSRGQTRVEMTYEDMQKLIRALLITIEVDQEFYLQHNKDVADEVLAGNIHSARGHFISHGYFEGRLPYRIDIDEAWYLRKHADVAETVRRGRYKSGQAHFDGPGYREGREPFAIKL